jgi:hypothetical protein
MALPPRAGAAYVLLGNADGTNQRSGAGIFGSYQEGSGGPPLQGPFQAYSWYFNEYPGQAVVKVSAAAFNRGIAKIVPVESRYLYKYPDNTVIAYDPDPPLSQPVPDPNGDIGEIEGYPIPSDTVGTPQYPRWYTDMAYDYSLDPGYWIGFVPDFPAPLLVNDFTLENIAFPGVGLWSWDVSVQNLESEVLNEATGEYEYYPFKQATSELKVTSKFKVVIETVICCWNRGTTVRGKVGFKAVDTTVEPVADPATPDYNYGGITVDTGTTFDDAGEADWEVVISDDFVPPEIEIPKVSGKITFINDFWVTEIVRP